MSYTVNQPPAGWYPDPAGSGEERYWDGVGWSQATRQVAGLDGPQQRPNLAGYDAHPQGHAYGVRARPGTVVLAGWWWRVLAAILDVLVLWIPNVALQNLFIDESRFQIELENWMNDVLGAAEAGRTELPVFPAEVLDALLVASIASTILYFIYRTVLVALFGGTAGQLITGLRVTREGAASPGAIGWGTATLRAGLAIVFASIPLFNLINVLMPAFTAKKQTFHDMIARTVVVKK